MTLCLLRTLVDEHNADPDIASPFDEREPRTIGKGSADQGVREFFKTVGLLLDRYRLIPGPALHRSATAVVLMFVDARAANDYDYLFDAADKSKDGLLQPTTPKMRYAFPQRRHPSGCHGLLLPLLPHARRRPDAFRFV